MMTLIKVEWRKLSHTPLLVASVMAPLLGSLAVLIIPLQHSRAIWFDYIATNLTVTHALLIPLVMGLVTAYVFGREYTDGTAASLRLSRFTVWQVTLAKWTTVLGMGVLMTGIAVTTAFVSGITAGFGGFYWEIVLRYVSVSLLSCAVAACSVPFVAVVAIWEKGSFAASVLAVAAPLSGVLLVAGFASRLNPWGLAMLLVTRFLNLVSRDPLQAMKPVYPTAVVSVLVGLMVTAVIQSRTDIQSER
ncbi:MAG: ABC transporter permease [Bacillota bacterium]